MANDLTFTEATSEDNVNRSEEQRHYTKEEKKVYRRDKKRIERIALENRILSYYFNDEDFVWRGDIETPDLNIISYPFTKGKQYVVRMMLPNDFPENGPSIQIGYYENDSSDPTLVKHLSGITFTPISKLFEGAKKYTSRMLEWEERFSLFRVYVVACTILYYSNIAENAGRNVGDYLNPFLEYDSKINDLFHIISNKIKEQKL